jgi:glyoxylase-like metal-dependent hydrolase (beta-lactamase superfamily II)
VQLLDPRDRRAARPSSSTPATAEDPQALGRTADAGRTAPHPRAFDHRRLAALHEATAAPIRLHADDFPLYDALPAQAAHFGLSAEDPAPPGRAVEDGEVIRFGRFAVTAIHTPGHTPGSTCYRLEGAEGGSGVLGVLLSGDTLFRRSIGRTDLWGGDTATILSSIRERLYRLPGELRVICGHGPDTTIAEEKERNPFVRE